VHGCCNGGASRHLSARRSQPTMSPCQKPSRSLGTFTGQTICFTSLLMMPPPPVGGWREGFHQPFVQLRRTWSSWLTRRWCKRSR